MKTLVNLLIVIAVLSVNAQGKYLTRTGQLDFEASVPSFEEVAAKNSAVTAILNTENGEFAALALVTGFRFKNALMEEHFNENYAESEKYPKATFKGKLGSFSADELGSEATKHMINGELEFHGVKKSFEDIELSLTKQGDTIILTGEFVARASDFKIKIPKVVSNKLRDDVNISFTFELLRQ